MWLIAVTVTHSQMVADTSALTNCCSESACVPARFLKAFHAFHHVSHETVLCDEKENNKRAN